ncbi:hypothetical protein N44_03334 [Microcystis aeruginosa NIES-44]|uniref:Uncharacterized protein n=1 Tax=Microcystis aeruginosa NIES-44 TaxID=449439 RepID=A0A0A1VZ00_MICAE|nr:hypothetical protein N44_03334 [Microcystis aeruginosa NIES-44]
MRFLPQSISAVRRQLLGVKIKRFIENRRILPVLSRSWLSIDSLFPSTISPLFPI